MEDAYNMCSQLYNIGLRLWAFGWSFFFNGCGLSIIDYPVCLNGKKMRIFNIVICEVNYSFSSSLLFGLNTVSLEVQVGGGGGKEQAPTPWLDRMLPAASVHWPAGSGSLCFHGPQRGSLSQWLWHVGWLRVMAFSYLIKIGRDIDSPPVIFYAAC